MSEKYRIRVTASKEVTFDEKQSIEERANRPSEGATVENETLRRIKNEGLEIATEEFVVLDFANKITADGAHRAGIEPTDVPRDRFHILPDTIYRELFDGEAVAYRSNNNVDVVFDEKYVHQLPLLGKIAIHEVMHSKAHTTLHASINNDNQIILNRMRDGVSVISLPSSESGAEHFRGLHEAIVATREKLSFADLLEIPTLSASKIWRNRDDVQSLWNEVSLEENIPADDIAWIWFEQDKVAYKRFSYHHHREVLQYICSEIQSNNSEKFEDWVGVYSKFENAHYNGKLLEIARLVEEQFGKGSFRTLGEMTDSDESAIQCLEKLKLLSDSNSY
jgi:hypothetical protein